MTGKLSKNFHGVAVGPLSNILAVKEEGWKKVLLLLLKVNSITANQKFVPQVLKK